ncbi:MAG: hypothetical protein HY912_16170 [Desulfomonile tiedjei]|uniref:Uncharacterized protein n=1 Tax=Desulfomonile tiedjei TaxID=2358 RepID=A0A9D6Z7E3_9BACT|nr:hypothetical protein [Desulfomonile tiedjei]
MDSPEWVYWFALMAVTSMVLAIFIFEPLLNRYHEWKLKREFWLREQRDRSE